MSVIFERRPQTNEELARALRVMASLFSAGSAAPRETLLEAADRLDPLPERPG